LVLMALGITNRTRKTGLEKAMTIEEVSVIAALAYRVHNTNIERQLKIRGPIGTERIKGVLPHFR
jgi:hypothetical protein